MAKKSGSAGFRDLQKLVEGFGELTIFLDKGDMEVLRERLEDISSAIASQKASAKGNPTEGALSRSSDICGQLLEKLPGVFQGSDQEFEIIRTVVAEGASALQALIVYSRPHEEIRVPEKLLALQAVGSSDDTAPEAVQPSGSGADPKNVVIPGIDSFDNILANAEFLEEFVTESLEHLGEAEERLMSYERDRNDMESINGLFRSFHTIKGVAGFLDLTNIKKVSHDVETLLDRVRRGEVILTDSAVDMVFRAVDLLKEMVEIIKTEPARGDSSMGGRADEFLKCLSSVNSQDEPVRQIEVMQKPGVGESASSAEKAGAGQSSGDFQSGDSQPVDLIIEEGAGKSAGTPELLAAVGVLGEFDNLGAPSSDSEEADLDITVSALDRAAEKQLSEDSSSVSAAVPVLASASVSMAAGTSGEGGDGKDASREKGVSQFKETVRVDAERLDRLVDTIGELVIAESMVVQSEELKGQVSTVLGRYLNQLDKITRELQEIATALRMVPIRPLFQKMARLTRDLSRQFGKEVDFIMHGDEIEIDKSVVERIGDPLVHMIRNSLDHGVEKPEARVKNGKRKSGSLTLRAFQKGGNIYIEVEDDGQGLNHDAIIRKAVERGIIADGASLSDREINHLIFEPGFSTAAQVTDVSGRGVGMDVVKRNIEALRGGIEITNRPGQGAVFSIRLPLTLAIIEGMVVMIGEERYIIPTLSILQLIRPDMRDFETMVGRGEMLRVQGKIIPLYRVDRLYAIDSDDRKIDNQIVVVVENDGLMAGLVVDQILGQQQIVIKSLGEAMKGIPGLSGGAIMPDGQVGLILDVSGLVRLANF